MCGIVGITGNEAVSSNIIGALKKLEYRGYDSTGVAVDDGQSIQTHKTVGKVADLKAILPASVQGTLGIAHTR